MRVCNGCGRDLDSKLVESPDPEVCWDCYDDECIEEYIAEELDEDDDHL